MNSPKLWKTWKVSEALLHRARQAIPMPDESTKEEFERFDAQFVEMLDHNEHELALDMLEEMGWLTHPRGEFWKDLERAAANMNLEDRIPRLQSGFHKAIQRITEA